MERVLSEVGPTVPGRHLRVGDPVVLPEHLLKTSPLLERCTPFHREPRSMAIESHRAAVGISWPIAISPVRPWVGAKHFLRTPTAGTGAPLFEVAWERVIEVRSRYVITTANMVYLERPRATLKLKPLLRDSPLDRGTLTHPGGVAGGKHLLRGPLPNQACARTAPGRLSWTSGCSYVFGILPLAAKPKHSTDSTTARPVEIPRDIPDACSAAENVSRSSPTVTKATIGGTHRAAIDKPHTANTQEDADHFPGRR